MVKNKNDESFPFTAESFVITSRGEVVKDTVLEEYAFKSEGDRGPAKKGGKSKQIQDDVLFPADSFYPYFQSKNVLVKIVDENTWHSRSCDIIAIDTAGKGYYLEGVGDDPDESEKERLEEFMDELYPTFRKLIYKRELDVKSFGNGAIEVIRNREGELTDLKYFSVYDLHRNRDNIRFAQKKGLNKVWFIKMGATDEEGNKLYVHSETGELSTTPFDFDVNGHEIMWRVEHTVKSKFIGQTKVISAFSAVYGDKAQSNYNIDFFKNYGKPSLLITVSGNYQRVDRNSPNYLEENDIIETIKKNVAKLTENPHSTMVLGIPTAGIGGSQTNNIKVDVTPLNVDVTDSSFQVYRKDNRDEIIAAHGADPTRLGIVDVGRLNSSTAIQSDSVYKVTTIETRRMDIEDEWHKYITQGEFEIFDWKVKILDNDPKNVTADVNNLERLLNMGVATPQGIANFIGDHYKLPSPDDYPGTDDYYMNGQKMISLDNTGIPEEESLMNLLEREEKRNTEVGADGESVVKIQKNGRLQRGIEALKKLASR